jgi:uncharacterized membrane protein YheB (UPF0754 family)
MTWWLIMIPFISAFTGSAINHVIIMMLFYPRFPRKIAGFIFQGIIPKKQ